MLENVINSRKFKLYRGTLNILKDDIKEVPARLNGLTMQFFTNERVLKAKKFLNANPIIKVPLMVAGTMTVGMVFRTVVGDDCFNNLMNHAVSTFSGAETAYASEIDTTQTVSSPQAEAVYVEPQAVEATVQPEVQSVEPVQDVQPDVQSIEPVQDVQPEVQSVEPAQDVQARSVDVDAQSQEIDTNVDTLEAENTAEQDETKSVEAGDQTIENSQDNVNPEVPTEGEKTEENYLEPVYAVDGVDISDLTSSQGQVVFNPEQSEQTNCIIIEGKDGHKTVIWTDQSYGNPNQSLLHQNLVESELTKLDPNIEWEFYSEWDYTDQTTGFKYCEFEGGTVKFDPATGSYEILYDKSLFTGVMGVDTTFKEYIDPDAQKPIKPIEPEPTPDPEPEPTSDPEPEPTPDPEPEPTPDPEPEPTPDPEPEPTPIVTEEYTPVANVLPQTGDEHFKAAAVAGTVAAGAAATMAYAAKKNYVSEASSDITSEIQNLNLLRDTLLTTMSEDIVDDFINKMGRSR